MRIRGEVFKTWRRQWQCWLLARPKTVSSLPVPSGHFPLPFLPCLSRHPLFPSSHRLQSHLTARGQIGRDSAREGRMPQRGHTLDWQEGRLVEETSGQAPSHTHLSGSLRSLYCSFSLLVLTLLICVSDSSICLVPPALIFHLDPLSSSSLTQGFLCCSPLRSWSHSFPLGFGPFVKPQGRH